MSADALQRTQLTALLQAAAARIEMSLRESHAPVEEIAAGIERLSAEVGRLRAAHGSVPGIARCCDALQGDLHASIERLQFYDRMSQELTLVRDCLAQGAAGGAGARLPADAWDALRTRICNQLTSESQRALLWAVVTEPVPSVGSVELF